MTPRIYVCTQSPVTVHNDEWVANQWLTALADFHAHYQALSLYTGYHQPAGVVRSKMTHRGQCPTDEMRDLLVAMTSKLAILFDEMDSADVQEACMVRLANHAIQLQALNIKAQQLLQLAALPAS